VGGFENWRPPARFPATIQLDRPRDFPLFPSFFFAVGFFADGAPWWHPAHIKRPLPPLKVVPRREVGPFPKEWLTPTPFFICRQGGLFGVFPDHSRRQKVLSVSPFPTSF